jgi:hypothetical protein
MKVVGYNQRFFQYIRGTKKNEHEATSRKTKANYTGQGNAGPNSAGSSNAASSNATAVELV